MTFIVVGKIDEKPFLAVDAKSTAITPEGKVSYKYFEKLWSFETAVVETYFTGSGQAMIAGFLRMYDEFLKRRNVLFDFKRKDHMKNLIRFINYVKANYMPEVEFQENKLFFISVKDVYRYWLIPGKDNKRFKVVPKLHIINNKQVTNSCINFRKSIENIVDIKGFCKDYLLKSAEKYDKDLRDRITYLISDGKKLVHTEPHKDFYDIVAMFLDLDFDTIDKRKFKFGVMEVAEGD